MRTVLYLLRHGATAANLSEPPRLQGRQQNPPLADIGVRQVELTRDSLAVRADVRGYTSPLLRPLQTAEIIAAPHGITPVVCDDLTECDVGRWEGLDWPSIRKQEPESYQKFMATPAAFGYPGGESFADVYNRGARSMEELVHKHEGESVLIVSHHV